MLVPSLVRFFSQGCMVAAAAPTFASSLVPIQWERVSALVSALSEVSANSHGISKTLRGHIIISKSIHVARGIGLRLAKTEEHDTFETVNTVSFMGTI